ncbi:MAG: DUF4301 family protein [Bacteroidota bacterium]
MFSEQDLTQFQSLGISTEQVEAQINNFKSGFPYLNIKKAATVGDGIIRLSGDQVDTYVRQYEAAFGERQVCKFVPASGAASRMFKALFAALNAPGEPLSPALQDFFTRIRDFAFADTLDKALDGKLDELVASQSYTPILAALLTDGGMDYGALPKGLLEFHAYDEGTRTPLEEHLVEGANYGGQAGGTAFLHFTVSPEHQSRFEAKVAEVKASLESQFGLSYDISFSEQKASTNTIAVDMKNEPFREAGDQILFRPGGHGALLENLNEIEADLIFIKNIDNVVPDHLKTETYRYKKAIAGILLEYQVMIHAYLKALDSDPAAKMIEEIRNFLSTHLGTSIDLAAYPENNHVQILRSKLNRPIRVCGMVINEGEPGGGPFWVQQEDGSLSLQIAESAQIDPDHEGQQEIVKTATHFNPVDLVCATKDHEGNSFDLLEFRDPSTGFIAYKSKGGRDLKAQELPGLWNGSMANWNTIFVEVPAITFNPVKTVNDLLRPQHQR